MRLALRLFVALLALGLAPATARAVPSTTVDIKAHPSVLKANTEVDVPVYLVENRAATDASLLTGGKLYSVKADLASTHSRFVSFTPDPRFDDDSLSFPTNAPIQFVRIRQDGSKSRLHFYIRTKTTGGLPITLDNSGITGRTEVFIGTLRIAVGPVVEVGGRKMVFDATFYDDPSAGYPIAAILKTGCICNLSSMASKGIRVFDDDVVPEGIAPGDGTPTDPGGTATPPATTPATPDGVTPPVSPPAGPTPACAAATRALKSADTKLASAKRTAAARAKAAKRKPSVRNKRAAKQAQTSLKKARTAQKAAAKRAKTAC